MSDGCQLKCLHCGETIDTSFYWLRTNGRVGCMHCNRSFSVDVDELQQQYGHLFDKGDKNEDFATFDEKVIEEEAKDYTKEEPEKEKDSDDKMEEDGWSRLSRSFDFDFLDDEEDD